MMDTHTALRRKDTTKGPPLRILSLDGGGVRGYSMLIIIQDLMHRTFVETEGKAPRKHQIPKPADHFDLIVGTGTGGLIAIMLGRLRLDLETCKEVYVQMTKKIYVDKHSAVTATYKGTNIGGQPAVLRSYDSRKEPSPEFDCKIWEAGRATSATGLAFKPIQIGQSVFIDEGAGQFNPTPVALDEACINEWPGRDVGLVVSIGTGKRPAGSDTNSHLWYEDFMGDFAEARRRLISKIEGCEETHQYLVREGLAKRGVGIQNYYRFNVEIGVGEFGMNEWNRLADISTSTRRYLGRPEVQRMTDDAAAKLGKIFRAKARHEAERTSGVLNANVQELKILPDLPEPHPNAVELPADVPIMSAPHSPSTRPSYDSGRHDVLEVPSNTEILSPSCSSENHSHVSPMSKASQFEDERLVYHAPTLSDYEVTSGADKIVIFSNDEQPRPPPTSSPTSPPRIQPPPLPPKTPILDASIMGRPRPRPPYPVDSDEEPPPLVNKALKPDYKGR